MALALAKGVQQTQDLDGPYFKVSKLLKAYCSAFNAASSWISKLSKIAWARVKSAMSVPPYVRAR